MTRIQGFVEASTTGVGLHHVRNGAIGKPTGTDYARFSDSAKDRVSLPAGIAASAPEKSDVFRADPPQEPGTDDHGNRPQHLPDGRAATGKHPTAPERHGRDRG